LSALQSINEDEIQRYFGDLPGTGSGYVLFYQAVNLNMDAVGMPAANGSHNLAQGLQQGLNDQNGTFDLKMYDYEKTDSNPPNNDYFNGKYDIRLNQEVPSSSSTDSSVNGLPVVLEERRSRWGLRKNRKDSTKERR